MPSCLHIVYDRFCVMTALSSCNQPRLAHKAQNIYSLPPLQKGMMLAGLEV